MQSSQKESSKHFSCVSILVEEIASISKPRSVALKLHCYFFNHSLPKDKPSLELASSIKTGIFIRLSVSNFQTRQKGLQSNCGPMLSILLLAFVAFLAEKVNWLDKNNNNSYRGCLLTAPDRSKNLPSQIVSRSMERYTYFRYCMKVNL